jgi:hypothetical protein
MTSIYLCSVIIQVICILLAMLVFLSIKNIKNQTRDKQLLIAILYSYLILTVTDIFDNLARGSIFILPYYLNAVVNAVCFSAAGAGCYYWFVYMDERTERSILKKPIIQKVMKAPIYFLYALNALSIFTSWIFIIQPDGTYQEGPLFVLQEAIPIFYLIAAFGHLIVEIASHRARNKKKRLHQEVWAGMSL